MITKRISILIAVLLLSVSSLPVYAAPTVKNTTQTSTAGTGKERAQKRIYTAEELCCMAQYYYKRTSKTGYYPPETSYKKLKDGSYQIVLRELISRGKEKKKYKNYARYTMQGDGSGKDEKSGKKIDLTRYSKVYTPEELCKLAQDYYYRTYDFYPPNADYTANKDGTYTICLYEEINDDEGTAHNATCGWLTVNVCGVGQDDLMLTAVDINP